MADYAISGDVATLLGDDHTAGDPAALWVESSAKILVDSSTGRVGGRLRVTLADDGTFTQDGLPETVAGVTPLYRLVVDSLSLRRAGLRKGYTTNWFPLEADRDLTWVIENYVDVTAITPEIAANVAAAAALGATNDTATASFVADPASATATALAATIAAAVDGLGSGGSNSYAVDLMHTLDHDTSDAVLAVSGDSVSIDSDGWVRRLTNKLAARYPKFTVVYKAKDGTNPTYAADVTVQTGTGGNGNTLTVYNWSQSGATVSIGYNDDDTYSIAYPVQPDLFLIATGHNDWNVPTSEMYRYITDGAQRIARRHPGTPVAVVTMNPKNPAESHYLHKFRTEQVKIAAAGQLGLGVLDLETAWIDRPGGYASLMADDIHPNSDGSELLATTAFDAFTTASPGGGDGQPRLVQQTLLVPIIGGVAGGGTPSAVAQAGYGQTYGVRFQHNSDDTWVCPPVLIPQAWASFSAELVWCVQGNSGAGEAFYLTVDYSCLSAGNNAPASLMFESTVEASSKPQGQTQVSTLVTDSPPHVPPAFAHVDGYPTPWAPWQFRIKRTSSHASDTLADGFGDVLLYALRLSRVS